MFQSKTTTRHSTDCASIDFNSDGTRKCKGFTANQQIKNTFRQFLILTFKLTELKAIKPGPLWILQITEFKLESTSFWKVSEQRLGALRTSFFLQ